MLCDFFCDLLLVSHLVVNFVSVIIAMVMGDMRCVRVVPRNKMSMFSRSVGPDRQSKQTEGESKLILLLEPMRQVYSKNFVIIASKNIVTK